MDKKNTVKYKQNDDGVARISLTVAAVQSQNLIVALAIALFFRKERPADHILQDPYIASAIPGVPILIYSIAVGVVYQFCPDQWFFYLRGMNSFVYPINNILESARMIETATSLTSVTKVFVINVLDVAVIYSFCFIVTMAVLLLCGIISAPRPPRKVEKPGRAALTCAIGIVAVVWVLFFDNNVSNYGRYIHNTILSIVNRGVLGGAISSLGYSFFGYVFDALSAKLTEKQGN